MPYLLRVVRVRNLALPLALLAVAAGVFLLARSGASDSDAAPSRKPPVVMVLFDEFPSDSLRTPDGRIDAERFPSFARFAQDATWYANSRAVHDSTPFALPAIMDGRLPRNKVKATTEGHPQSVFSLLGEAGWQVTSSEEATDICGERFCPGSAEKRKGILANLANGRPERWGSWLSKIRRGERATLHFKHTLVPHLPWIFLPSGQQTITTMSRLANPAGFGDRDLTRHNEGRHLLQVGYVDHLIGRLMARLKRAGLYDRALIVLTADHGVAFDLNTKDRRSVTQENVDEITPTPFFIKTPHQQEGKVDDAFVSNVDVVPTMARALHLDIPWKVDGKPASSPELKRVRRITLPNREFTRRISIGGHEWLRRRAAQRRERAATFGTGASSIRRTGSPWGLIYGGGPTGELLGRSAGSLTLASGGAAVPAQISQPEIWASVRPRERQVPTQVAGFIQSKSPSAKRNLAVAVNGRIEAVGRSFRMEGKPMEMFSLIVRPSSLRSGRNRISLYEVTGSKGAWELRLLQSV